MLFLRTSVIDRLEAMMSILRDSRAGIRPSKPMHTNSMFDLVRCPISRAISTSNPFRVPETSR